MSGYSREAIAAHYNQLVADGVRHGPAVAEAHRAARAAYWKRYPAGHLPAWIFPDPVHKRVGPLNRGVKGNPSPRVSDYDANGAAELYRAFAGKPADSRAQTRKPRIPDALACIGQVTVIQYVAERDGEVNEYRHPFAAKHRPHLCVSPDGKLVLMLGGAFTFTQDGFVDGK